MLPRLLFRPLLGRRLPHTFGTLHVAGQRARVTVARDEWGSPYVEAENDADAWFALGFCQGQDRAFQLETLLLVVRGTLSEMVGAGGLGVDRLSRRVGFRHYADLQLPHVGADILGQIDAYTRGIYQGATVGTRRKAHEFVLLRCRPTPWEPADVLAVLKLQSCLLSSNTTALGWP